MVIFSINRKNVISALIIHTILILENGNLNEESSTNIQQDEINLARTLIVVVLVFLICQSVKLIPDVYEVVACPGDPQEECQSPIWIEAIIDISHLLLAINSSINFIIYTVARKYFLENVTGIIQKSKYLQSLIYVNRFVPVM